MDVEWPLRCISKSPQESVVERSSSSFQEIFQRRFVNQSFGALGTVVCQQNRAGVLFHTTNRLVASGPTSRRGQLRDAPEFSDNSWQDRDWETRTYRHYGAPGYWETRTGM